MCVCGGGGEEGRRKSYTHVVLIMWTLFVCQCECWEGGVIHNSFNPLNSISLDNCVNRA